MMMQSCIIQELEKRTMCLNRLNRGLTELNRGLNELELKIKLC
jgi:hypothetical protein